nr:lysozyme inhibitor LprI family protein [Pseudomonas atagonensis]
MFLQQAQANGMDCTKASNAVESAICASKNLYELDSRMGTLYRDLMKVTDPSRTDVKTAQRQWLKVRNQCTNDVDCLQQRYLERLQVLNAQWVEAAAYQPDDVDQQAMVDLQQRIQAMAKENPEFALERALESLSVKTGSTTFSDESGEDDQTFFPKAQPTEVTPDEWRALTASGITGAADFGPSSYTLMDLDGDGQRDLIVSTYTGGTGLFTYTETFRRTANRFIRRSAVPDPDSSESSLFYTNDRGANQANDWINIRGRIYAAYRNSAFGIDRLQLLNPLKINSSVPVVTVRYRYDLEVPGTQHKDDGVTPFELEPDLRLALNKALVEVNQTGVGHTHARKEPLCPVPPIGAGEYDYYTYGPGHYTIEMVADLPVIIGSDCYIGTLVDWFGSYSKSSGLFAQLAIRKPEAESGHSYEVNGRRHLTEVSTSMEKVEADNSL